VYPLLDFQQFNLFSFHYRAAQSLTATLWGRLSEHIFVFCNSSCCSSVAARGCMRQIILSFVPTLHTRSWRRHWMPRRTLIEAYSLLYVSNILLSHDQIDPRSILSLVINVPVAIRIIIISHNICYGANQPELSSASHN